MGLYWLERHYWRNFCVYDSGGLFLGGLNFGAISIGFTVNNWMFRKQFSILAFTLQRSFAVAFYL